MQIKAREVTSVKKVLRLAAEIIDHDMHEYKPKYREGCCEAFARIRYVAYHGTRNYQLALKRADFVNEAEDLFERLFRPEGDYGHGHGYWMGEQRTDKQQERRITALLSAAESLHRSGIRQTVLNRF